MKKTLSTTLFVCLMLAACASVPQVPVSERTYQFTVAQVRPADIVGYCGEGYRACVYNKQRIILPTTAKSKPSRSSHTVRVVRYPWRGSPCPYACVVDGVLHTEVTTLSGKAARFAGEALAEAAGVDVPPNRYASLWHEFRHVEGYKH